MNLIEKYVPSLSRLVANSGEKESIKGYLTPQEFVDAVAKNYRNWTGLGFAAALVLSIAESYFSANPGGTWGPIVLAFLGAMTGYIKTVRSAEKSIEKGKDIEDL